MAAAVDTPQRFVALDLHKSSLMVGAVAADQNVVLAPRRFDPDAFRRWAERHLLPTDAVVLEATTNAWDWVDFLAPLVASVTVAHPYQVQLIAKTRVKTDARDTLALARLLAAGLIPSVWVPPVPVRELRALIAHRGRLISTRTQARNRLHALLHRHNLAAPAGDPFAPAQRAWWDALPLSDTEALRLAHDFTLLETLAPLIQQVDRHLARLSADPLWQDAATRLLQLPGLGLIGAMTLLSAIGDITRFPSAKQLVGYAGLGASVYASGKTQRTGAITKQGRREMRAVLVEAAWAAVASHPFWQARFDRLAHRIGKGKAIVALARQLLVVVWHGLTDQVADRHARPEKIAKKFLEWAWQIGRETRPQPTAAAFVRDRLQLLTLGEEVTCLIRSGRRYALPAPEAVPPG